ncbi:MAG: CarD family transcriptional regulator, partial [Bacteroidota bacterium]
MKNLLSYFPKGLHGRTVETLDENRNITLSGVSGYSSKAFVVSDYLRSGTRKLRKVFWVTNSKSERDLMMREFPRWSGIPAFTLDLTKKFNYESDEIEVIQIENSHKDKVELVYFLAQLLSKEQSLSVVPFFYLQVQLPSPEDIRKSIFSLTVGQKIGPLELFDLLISNSYQVSPDLQSLLPGFYFRSGDVVNLWPANFSRPVRIDIEFDAIQDMYFFDSLTGEVFEKEKVIQIYSLRDYDLYKSTFTDYLQEDVLFIEDELDIHDEFYEQWNLSMEKVYRKSPSITFVLFNEDTKSHQHLHYLSFLKYHTLYDFVNDVRDKVTKKWSVFIFTKDQKTLETIFLEHNLQSKQIFFFKEEKDETFPFAFQNPEMQVALFTDREISFLKDQKKKSTSQKVFLDFMSGLKVGDYVVHADHGIARFLGLEQRKIDELTREYLKLGYAENDKLFVPIEQADKVNKYIANEDSPPKLTRLGSAEWDTVTSKVKRETEQIAQELLKLYAERKAAKGFAFAIDDDVQEKFESTFPYEETPGQIKAIVDV